MDLLHPKGRCREEKRGEDEEEEEEEEEEKEVSAALKIEPVAWRKQKTT